MEVDTGASVSIISKRTQLKLFPKSVLHKTDAVLKTYTGEGMTALGELKGLKVHYCEHKDQAYWVETGWSVLNWTGNKSVQ